MTSFVRITALGNTTEPSFKYTASGTAQLTFSLAVNRSHKDKDSGQWVDDPPEWVSCVVWGDQAERLSTQIKKGQPVYIDGRPLTRSWNDDQGQKHTRTEVQCNLVYPHSRAPRQEKDAAVDDDFVD